MCVISWFDQHQGFALALLTLVYAGATVWLVVETRRSVNELRLARIEQNRPYIALSVEDRADGLPILALTNNGQSTASRVKVTLPADLPELTSGVLKPETIRALGSGNVTLAPRQRIIFALYAPGDFTRLAARGPIRVPVEFEGLGGRQQDTVTIDFSTYASALVEQRDTPDVLWEVHTDLKDIRDMLKRLLDP